MAWVPVGPKSIKHAQLWTIIQTQRQTPGGLNAPLVQLVLFSHCVPIFTRRASISSHRDPWNASIECICSRGFDVFLKNLNRASKNLNRPKREWRDDLPALRLARIGESQISHSSKCSFQEFGARFQKS